MALVSDGFGLNVTLVDASGVNKSTLRFPLDYADWAAFNTGVGAGEIDTILNIIGQVTDATILGYTVGQSFVEDTDSVGAAGSEVENVALITCLIDGYVNKYATLRIPAPTDGIFLAATGPNRNIVDVDDAAVQAYLSLFENGTGYCTISDGEYVADPTVAGNAKGKRIHRGSRKG